MTMINFKTFLAENIVLVKDIAIKDIFVDDNSEKPGFYEVVSKNNDFVVFKPIQTMWIKNKKTYIPCPVIGSYSSNKKYEGSADQLGIKIYVNDANIFLTKFDVMSQSEYDKEMNFDADKKPEDEEETITTGPEEDEAEFTDDFGSGEESEESEESEEL